MLNNVFTKFKKLIIIKIKINTSIIKNIIEINDEILIIFSLMLIIAIVKIKIDLMKH